VVGTFPDGNPALILVAARLRHVASTRWGAKRYLQINRLADIIATQQLLTLTLVSAMAQFTILALLSAGRGPA
jgi:hypothetical protein